MAYGDYPLDAPDKANKGHARLFPGRALHPMFETREQMDARPSTSTERAS